MGDQPTFPQIRGKMVTFTRQDILRAIPIQDIPEVEHSFSYMMNEMPNPQCSERVGPTSMIMHSATDI